MRLLAFAASLRQASLNRRLLGHAVQRLRGEGAEVDLVDMATFEMPLYSAEIQERGFPPGAEEFKRRLDAADGLVIASPEYNYSFPGHLKNAIDWVSRYQPRPFRGKSALLLSASPSVSGGIQGLWQLRVPLEALGVFVYPDMFALAKAPDMLAPDGSVQDPVLEERLGTVLAGYWRFAQAVATL